MKRYTLNDLLMTQGAHQLVINATDVAAYLALPSPSKRMILKNDEPKDVWMGFDKAPRRLNRQLTYLLTTDRWIYKPAATVGAVCDAAGTATLTGTVAI